jgi:hypothetical protein
VGEGLAVTFTHPPGTTEIRFLVAQLVANAPQAPVIVSITPDGPITPKGLNGTVAVSTLAGKLLKQVEFNAGQVVDHTEVGKAPGLAQAAPRPLLDCRQPDTDNCVGVQYLGCTWLLFIGFPLYLACVAIGVGYCMAVYCN